MTRHLDHLILDQLAGTTTPARAAKTYTGHDNGRTQFSAACWRRLMELLEDKPDMRLLMVRRLSSTKRRRP